MKKSQNSKYMFALATLFGVTVGCEDVLKVDTPDFDVTLATVNAVAGDPVVFNFTGDADIIAFYPGDIGHTYEYRQQGRMIPMETLTLDFTTVFNNRNNNIRNYTYDVYTSTDFSGNYERADVETATWVDITENFEFDFSRDTPVIPSGVFDMASYIEAGDPFYIAFRYWQGPVPTNQAASCQLRSFNLACETILGKVTLANLTNQTTNAGFAFVDFAIGSDESENLIQGNISVTAQQATGRIDIQGVNQSGVPTTKESIIWAISRQFDPGPTTLPCETTIPIKGTSDVTPPKYSYTYSEPGIYTAYFVARNITSGNSKEVLKAVQIVVGEPNP